MWSDIRNYQRNPGSVTYAHYYGKLNKEGEIGLLKTIILSNDWKVYQLHGSGAHVELKWQNEPQSRKKGRPYGQIYLVGEGKGYETNLKPVFISELGIYI